jgi:four helix bundle protein
LAAVCKQRAESSRKARKKLDCPAWLLVERLFEKWIWLSVEVLILYHKRRFVEKYLSFVIGHYSFFSGKRMGENQYSAKVRSDDKDSRANDLENRLIDFAVRIIRVTERLPSSSAGNHIARQLMRSGTSPAPNYAEARGAESEADFVHKLKISLKELNESCVWLKIICRTKMLPTDALRKLIDENQQLCRILNSSIKTVRSNSSLRSKKSSPK